MNWLVASKKEHALNVTKNAEQISDDHSRVNVQIDAAPLLLAATAAVAMCISTALLTWYWRRQVGDGSPLEILSLVLFTGALIQLSGEARFRFLSCDLSASFSVFLPLCLFLFGCLAGHSGVAAAAIYPIILACWFLGLLRLWRAGLLFGQHASAICIGTGLGALNFFVINHLATSTVFQVEAALVGRGHIDALYHASIASLIANFGTLSTGLDGFVPVKYHAFSHFIFGNIALWLNVPAIKVYSIVMLVMGGPLLFYAAASAAFSLWQPKSKVAIPINLTLSIPFVLAIFEVRDWMSYLASESYLVALVFFLLSVPVLVVLARAQRLSHIAFSAVTAIGILPVILFTKISVGFVFAVCLFVIACLQILERRLFWAAIASAVVIAGAFLIWLALVPDIDGSTFSLGHFIKDFRPVAQINFVYLLAGVGVLILFGRPRDNDKIRIALALACVASAYPAIVLNLTGGAEYYFVNIGVWVAIVAFCGICALPALAQIRSRIPSIVALAVIVIAIPISPVKRDSVNFFLDHIQGILLSAGIFHPSDKIKTFAEAADGLNKLGAHLSSANSYRLLKELRSRLGDRSGLAVYIPPNNPGFWNLQNECRAGGFMIPAFLGIPLLLGVPANCKSLFDYSFGEYSDKSKNREVDDNELCRYGYNIALRKILRVDSGIQVREVDCTFAYRN